MDTQRLYQLLEAYAARATSPAEEQELFGLLNAGPERDIKGVLHQLQQASTPDPALDADRWQLVLERILATARTLETEEEEASADERSVDQAPIYRRLFPWGRVAGAAAVIGLLAAGVWLWVHRTGSGSAPAVAVQVHDVAPGGNHAILTLAGGKTIVLDSAANGLLAQQGGTQVQKQADGRLAYTGVAGGEDTHINYNTLTTPRGGQYQLTLSDGTKVWLNAASSITYPTAFVAKERSVTITGEAYLEVSKNPRQPFRVKVNDVDIDVLGTSFNVNAYADEPVMATTLLEGSIRVSLAGPPPAGGTGGTPPGTSSPKGAAVPSPSGEGVKLSPNQQAIVQEGKPLKVMKDADLDRVMAWRNGQFPLQGTDLGTLMRQIARWYDVEVHFNGAVPRKTFGGSISRNTNLSAVLVALKENGVDCRLDGKTIEIK